MAISNEQKVAAFDGIMDLIGKEALGEWKKGSEPPERPAPVLMIQRVGGKLIYLSGFYQGDGYYSYCDELVYGEVICWKYDDAENIVKLLKL